MVIVSFVVQTIDFTYNVMLSKLLGAEAMGLFQMIMSILMVFLIFSIFGIPTAVSKLVAEQNSKRNHYAIKNILGVALSLTLLISIFLSFFILLFGETISFKMFKTNDMLAPIYLLIPAIFLISTTAILSSYYYGLKMIIIPSISQIIEHLARFIIVLGFLYYVYPVDPLYGALIAISGIIIGEAFHLAWLMVMFNRFKKKPVPSSTNRLCHIVILKRILPIATPIGISGLLNVLLRLLNSIWIPQKLIEAGYTYSEAIGIFGRITGMTMPLIMLTFMVTSAMVTNLSEQMALKNYRNVNNNILFSIKITLLVSMPLTAVCIFFSEPLGIFLYIYITHYKSYSKEFI